MSSSAVSAKRRVITIAGFHNQLIGTGRPGQAQERIARRPAAGRLPFRAKAAGDSMSTPEAPWQAVLDSDGCPYTVQQHAAAHSVAERQALTFPWSQAVKTLAFATSDFSLLLVVLRAEDRVDFARLAALSGTSRSRLRAADAGLLAAEGLVTGGVPPGSHRPGVPCLIDAAVHTGAFGRRPAHAEWIATLDSRQLSHP